jgi:hypothetical protein
MEAKWMARHAPRARVGRDGSINLRRCEKYGLAGNAVDYL